MLGCGPHRNDRIADDWWPCRQLFVRRHCVYGSRRGKTGRYHPRVASRVHARRRRPPGHVRYVRSGDLLGGPALIGGPAPVFVQAVTHRSALFFDNNRVKRAARNDASLAWALAEEAVHRLYDVLEELAGNTFASVRQRVARHLLDLATSRLEASGTLTAVVNQQDLANSVGSVREVVARVLAELRAEHLVRTSPRRVEILDPVRMSRELWSRARDESHSA